MRRTSWTWNPRWMWPGISVAGILLRFSMANCLDTRSAGQLYRGIQQLLPTGHSFYGEFGSDFQDERIASLLGVEACAVRHAPLADVIERLSRASFMADRLRICPDCIALGYHAGHFQIEAIEVCPVYNKPLISHCPSCQAELSFFGICMQLLKTPFFCKALSAASKSRSPSFIQSSSRRPSISSFRNLKTSRAAALPTTSSANAAPNVWLPISVCDGRQVGCM